jgi:hypothetical protein
MRNETRSMGVQPGLAVVSVVLLVLALAWSDWIEALFGVDPDHGGGSLEWVVVGSTALAAIVFLALVARRWRLGRALKPGASDV